VSSEVPRKDMASSLREGTAALLRRHFDDSFAVPVSSRSELFEDLLAIRVGSDRYGLRLAEIGGLHVDLKIVPVPSFVLQLLGVVGIRGTMIPIYDLAMLLRYPLCSRPRWIALASGPQSVGFAFESFDSHLRVSAAALKGAESQQLVGERPLSGAVQLADALLPIIHLASVTLMLKGLKS
jgi:chemotaxis signal transduction protein